MLLWSIVSLQSCLVYGVTDPYFVDIDRQKENSYHAPSTINVPLLSNKNDLSFAAHYAIFTRHNGVDVHTAFIPAKHLGLQAGYRSYGVKGDAGGKVESFELGAGYVKDWDKFLFEAYAGIGGGKIRNEHYTGMSFIRYSSYYIQPAFAIQNKTTQFAFVLKLSPTNFEIVDTSFDGAREPFVANQLKILENKTNRVFVEPGFIFRTGWENIMLQTAFSFSGNISGDDFLRDKTNFSIGLAFRFNAGASQKVEK